MEKKNFKLLVMRVMGDSPFGASLLQLYVSVRNGASHSQVMASKLCWEEREDVTFQMSRKKSPNVFACCGFSPIHLCFQSS